LELQCIIIICKETRRNCSIERDACEALVGQTGIEDVSVYLNVRGNGLISVSRVSLLGSLTIVPQAVDWAGLGEVEVAG
jgi:hypothetical protein